MKTKTAMKPYVCYRCKDTIEKGKQYARTTITLGYSGTWGHSKDCNVCGDPIRSAEPLCDPCANPKEEGVPSMN